MKIQQINIDSIKPYANNQKKHDKKQIKQVADSIKRFGFIQPIVIDKNNEIVIGHARFEAALSLEMDRVPCVKADTLSEKEIKALRLADNKLNESPWNMELVVEELKMLDSELLYITGFDQDLILEPDSKDDIVPETPNKPLSKIGDLYELGSHRVLCGDSTQGEAFLRLLREEKAQMTFCDPPYNVDYQGGGSYANHKTGPKRRDGIQNDSMSKESFREFLSKAIKPILEYTDGGIYICMSSSEIDSLKSAFENGGGALAEFYYMG